MLNRRAREACKKKFTNHLLLLNFRYSICNNVQEKYCILEILLKTFLVFYPWNPSGSKWSLTDPKHCLIVFSPTDRIEHLPVVKTTNQILKIVVDPE